MKIVVLDGYALNPGDNPWDPVARHGELLVFDRSEEDQIPERAGEAKILLVNKTPLARATLEKLPRLRLICVLATGFNVVDVAAARDRGVPVCNVPEYGTDAVAQFTLASLLNLCHGIADHDRAVRDGEWARRRDFSFWLRPQIELAGLTLGIVGFGKIGRRVGELAHALGMVVVAYDHRSSGSGQAVLPGSGKAIPEYRPFFWRDLATLFRESDVVSLHCPLTAETKGMVDAKLLATMKPGAFLLNTARGQLINERDLAAALAEGPLAAAALDVVAQEPINADNPLLGKKNVVLTPHLAWSSLAARRRLMAATGENIAAFLAEEPIHVVNP